MSPNKKENHASNIPDPVVTAPLNSFPSPPLTTSSLLPPRQVRKPVEGVGQEPWELLAYSSDM